MDAQDELKSGRNYSKYDHDYILADSAIIYAEYKLEKCGKGFCEKFQGLKTSTQTALDKMREVRASQDLKNKLLERCFSLVYSAIKICITNFVAEPIAAREHVIDLIKLLAVDEVPQHWWKTLGDLFEKIQPASQQSSILAYVCLTHFLDLNSGAITEKAENDVTSQLTSIAIKSFKYLENPNVNETQFEQPNFNSIPNLSKKLPQFLRAIQSVYAQLVGKARLTSSNSDLENIRNFEEFHRTMFKLIKEESAGVKLVFVYVLDVNNVNKSSQSSRLFSKVPRNQKQEREEDDSKSFEFN